MKIYLIANNLFENNIVFENRENIEFKKKIRVLSTGGEDAAKKLALCDFLDDTDLILSSEYASSIGTAKYLASRTDNKVNIFSSLNDCKIGSLGNKNLKNIKFMQEHDFNIKLDGGESLNEVGDRVDKVIKSLISPKSHTIAIFTHKRCILGYLIKHAKACYNLDDELIIEYNDMHLYKDTDEDMTIIELHYDLGKLVSMAKIDLN